MPENSKVVALFLAGGSGKRMDGAVDDKVLAPLAGKPVIAHSYAAFVDCPDLDAIVFICRDASQQAAIEKLLPAEPPVSIIFTLGGQERQDSVWAGLNAVPSGCEIVLIHDCARPCIATAAVKESITSAREVGAACLARPVSDTIKSADPYDGAFLPTTVDRSKLWAMETPQSFQFPTIYSAYQQVVEKGLSITDDLSAIEDIDQPVAFVRNPRPNLKLTTSQDLAMIEYILGHL